MKTHGWAILRAFNATVRGNLGRPRQRGRFVATNPGDAQATFRLPESDMSELRAKARERNVSASELLRRWVRERLGE